MDLYFTLLEIIVNNLEISNRIRFMIQDVIDLRKNQWNPCRKENNPKTFTQILRSKVSNSYSNLLLETK